MFNVTLNKRSKINNGKPNLKLENYDQTYLCAHLYHRNYQMFLRRNLPKQTFLIRMGTKQSLANFDILLFIPFSLFFKMYVLISIHFNMSYIVSK